MDRKGLAVMQMVRRSSRLVGSSLSVMDRQTARRSATMEAIAETRHGIAVARMIISRRAVFRI